MTDLYCALNKITCGGAFIGLTHEAFDEPPANRSLESASS